MLIADIRNGDNLLQLLGEVQSLLLTTLSTSPSLLLAVILVCTMTLVCAMSRGPVSSTPSNQYTIITILVTSYHTVPNCTPSAMAQMHGYFMKFYCYNNSHLIFLHYRTSCLDIAMRIIWPIKTCHLYPEVLFQKR